MDFVNDRIFKLSRRLAIQVHKYGGLKLLFLQIDENFTLFLLDNVSEYDKMTHGNVKKPIDLGGFRKCQRLI
jgi:hypothetical protein